MRPDGIAHHFRIAEKLGAIRIGALHRLDHQMQRAVPLELAERKTFQHIEHLDQLHAAGRRRRHRDDVVAAIGAAHRRAAPLRGSLFKSSSSHAAAGGAHGGDDLLGDRAAIECRRAVARDRPQGGGQIVLHQRVAGAQAPSRRLSEKFLPKTASAPTAAARAAASRRCRPRPECRRGELDRRRDQLRERELAGAVACVRQRQPGHGAGHADRQAGIARFLRIGFAVGVEEDVARGRGRRGLAIVDCDAVDCAWRDGSA